MERHEDCKSCLFEISFPVSSLHFSTHLLPFSFLFLPTAGPSTHPTSLLNQCISLALLLVLRMVFYVSTFPFVLYDEVTWEPEFPAWKTEAIQSTYIHGKIPQCINGIREVCPFSSRVILLQLVKTLQAHLVRPKIPSSIVKKGVCW